MSAFSTYFMSFLHYAPLFLIWIIALFLAISRRSENPGRYQMVVIAMIVFLLYGIISLVNYLVLPSLILRSGMGMGLVQWIFTGMHFLAILIHIIAWILLLVGLFRK